MTYFSKQTYADFMQSAPKQIVLRAHKPTAGIVVDVKRCRRSALTSGWELPVFCSLDEIKVFELDDMDADFFYVSKPKGKIVEDLPYTGKRWYHKCNVLYLLETERISYNNILYSFRASGHLLGEALKEPLEIMDKAWSLCTNNLGKESANALIGLMGSKENFIYNCTISSHPDDAAMLNGICAEKRTGPLYQWVTRQKVIELNTMWPIHAFCLDMERLRISQITDIAIKLGTPRKSICEYRTDSVFISEVKLQKHFAEMKAEDLGCKGGKLFHVERCPPKEIVGAFDPTSECEEPNLKMDWNVIVERGDDVYAKAREIVVQNQQYLFVNGPGGVGKSTLVKQLVAELREGGHNVKTTALTHVAARVIEGQTIQSVFFRHVINGSSHGCLVIDEVSCLTISVLNFISSLLLADVKFILLGDFFQLPAVCDYWAGELVDNNGFQHSRLSWELSDGNVLQLTKCRRSADHLFNFVVGLYPNGTLGKIALHEQVALAKRVFPKQTGNARWNLVISHSKRKAINALCFHALKNGEMKNVVLAHELVNSVFVGCAIIGSTTDKFVTNGCFYEVISFTETHVTLQDIESMDMVDVPLEKMKHVRLGYAVTMASVQGRTLRGRTRIFDTDHPRFTTRHLAMCIGRVTKASDLDIA